MEDEYEGIKISEENIIDLGGDNDNEERLDETEDGLATPQRQNQQSDTNSKLSNTVNKSLKIVEDQHSHFEMDDNQSIEADEIEGTELKVDQEIKESLSPAQEPEAGIVEIFKKGK